MSIIIDGNSSGVRFTIFKKSTDNTNGEFADFAERDLYFSNNSSDLDFLDNDNTKLIKVLDDGTGNSVYQQRQNNTWVDSTIFIKGDTGKAGTSLEFANKTERDFFFNSNRDKLKIDLPIMVTVDGDVVMQYWRGASNPNDYDNVFWADASIKSGTSSFKLGDTHTISSASQNIMFTNELSKINWFPVWQGVGDHTTIDGRIVYNRATNRWYGELIDAEPFGAVNSVGSVDYDFQVSINSDSSFFGISVVLAENFNGKAIYTISNSGKEVYRQELDINKLEDESFDFWFRYPAEAKENDVYTVNIIKVDGNFLSVRPALSNNLEPYRITRIRPFIDKPIALIDDLLEYVRKDEIKEIFVLPKNGNAQEIGNWNVERISSTNDTHFVFKAPLDFNELIDCNIIVLPDNTETIFADINSSISKIGLQYDNLNNSLVDESLNVALGELNQFDVTNIVDGIDKDSYVAISFNSDTNHIQVVGMTLKYK